MKEGDTTYTSIITYNHFEVKADNGIHGTIRNVNESSLPNFFFREVLEKGADNADS
jgi:hypothetical protein